MTWYIALHKRWWRYVLTYLQGMRCLYAHLSVYLSVSLFVSLSLINEAEIFIDVCVCMYAHSCVCVA